MAEELVPEDWCREAEAWAGGGVPAGSVGQQGLLGTGDSLPLGSLPPQGEGNEGLEGTGK